MSRSDVSGTGSTCMSAGYARSITMVVAVLLLALGASAAEAARQHVLLVSGLGGDPFYSKQFVRYAEGIRDVLVSGQGVREDDIRWLRADPEDDLRKSTRPHVLSELKRLAMEAGPDDGIAIIYIGHASARGKHLKLNLPGPDLTASDLDSALLGLSSRQILIVLAAPVSGGFIPVLSAPGRVLVTATANVSENQQPQFAAAFAQAFADAGADLDKDGRVSVLEAFQQTIAQIRRNYERDGLILVEHGRIDDNGDGKGSDISLDASLAPGDDGYAARRMFLDIARVSDADGGDPVRVRLRLDARSLVDRIEQLKREKSKYFEVDYLHRLEQLLLQLALNRRAYRQGMGRNDADDASKAPAQSANAGAASAVISSESNRGSGAAQ